MLVAEFATRGKAAMRVLVLHSDPTIAHLLSDALSRLGLDTVTEPEPVCDLALVPWNDWDRNTCRRLLAVGQRCAERVVIMLEGGDPPADYAGPLLPAPCGPADLARLVRQTCGSRRAVPL